MISTSPSPAPMDDCILVEGPPAAPPPPQAVNAMLVITKRASSFGINLEDILSPSIDFMERALDQVEPMVIESPPSNEHHALTVLNGQIIAVSENASITYFRIRAMVRTFSNSRTASVPT